MRLSNPLIVYTISENECMSVWVMESNSEKPYFERYFKTPVVNIDKEWILFPKTSLYEISSAWKFSHTFVTYGIKYSKRS